MKSYGLERQRALKFSLKIYQVKQKISKFEGSKILFLENKSNLIGHKTFWRRFEPAKIKTSSERQENLEKIIMFGPYKIAIRSANYKFLKDGSFYFCVVRFFCFLMWSKKLNLFQTSAYPVDRFRTLIPLKPCSRDRSWCKLHLGDFLL